MTNTFAPKMVAEERGDTGLLRLGNSSPSKSRARGKGSPRGKTQSQEWEKSRVRFQQEERSSPGHSSPTAIKQQGNRGGQQMRSPRMSPTKTELYAGFSDSPAPAALPRPPSHWMSPLRFIQSCSAQAPHPHFSTISLINAQA